MRRKTYDIFISYRRRDTYDKAEHLYTLLTTRYGKCVSFDKDNLFGKFPVELIRRIDHARDFILLFGEQSLVYVPRTEAWTFTYTDAAGHSRHRPRRIRERIAELHPDWSGDEVRHAAARIVSPGNTSQHDYEAYAQGIGLNPADVRAFSPDEVAFYTHLATCTQQEFAEKINELGPNAPLDFVRIEAARALRREKLAIVPIFPGGPAAFASTDLPADIAGVKGYEAITYDNDADALFKSIIPQLAKHLTTPRPLRWRWSVFILLLIVALAGGWTVGRHFKLQRAEAYRLSLMTDTVGPFCPGWRADITTLQLEAVREMLLQMEHVDSGTFLMGPPQETDGTWDADAEPLFETPAVRVSVPSLWMGRYEVTVGQWCRIMRPTAAADSLASTLPMTGISMADCRAFCDTLRALTSLRFDIPTEAEWEFAARGGNEAETFTRYAGSDVPAEVARFAQNSGRHAWPCDGTSSGLRCNALNLFDMSGNVAEWCRWTDPDHRLYADMASGRVSTDVIYNQGQHPIRGGSYLSQPGEITVFHRDTALAPAPNIGLRLIVRKDF